MARIEWVEVRLREWGEWVRSEGRSDKSTGYPARNCLHPDWGRPGQGAAPSFNVQRIGRGSETHFHLHGLSETLQWTLLLVYGYDWSVSAVSKAMATSPATVDQRIWRAHAALAHVL
ncbi:MAG: hypothetical protein SHS37scaffold296_41 [Burkholderiales phage 68_11]|jgi:hypothetical protein|nr:MAG: hypothetical protein SHS37scaffold296_41 [Burkholderiales phage 68_11]